MAPLVELLGEVSRRLPGERRVGRAETLASGAVAACAGGETATGIALRPQSRRAFRCPRLLAVRHRGIVQGHGLARISIKPVGDPTHLRVVPPPVAISDQLSLQIARVERGQPGRAATVPASVEAVAADARIGRPGRTAAQRDQLASCFEPVRGRQLSCGAAAHDDGCGEQEAAAEHGAATRTQLAWFLPLLLLAACKPPPDPVFDMPQANAAQGKRVIERVGCGSCHHIPGVDWPRGKVGPALSGLSGRALIAGRLPNRPDILAAYIRNAPALVPNSAMPAMPVGEQEARDIAAYLYDQGSN